MKHQFTLGWILLFLLYRILDSFKTPIFAKLSALYLCTYAGLLLAFVVLVITSKKMKSYVLLPNMSASNRGVRIGLFLYALISIFMIYVGFGRVLALV
jgi:ABC-type tungstate transport system substrate-binding protein